MRLTDRIYSLILVVLMMTAAAIAVNKSLFGNDLRPSVNEEPTIEADEGETIVSTAGLDNTINGYGGPVNFYIHIEGGKITAIEPQPNSETPRYFERTLPLLDSWIGKTPKEALMTRVDAVSGATYSSRAMIRNVRIGIAYYQGSHADTSEDIPLKIWIALAVTLAACIVPLFVSNRAYHTAQMIANVAILGFWAGQMLDYHTMLNTLSYGFSLPAAPVVIAMLIAAFIYPIFGKPQHYCTHICPLGSAQQLAASICGYKLHIPPQVVRVLEWMRRILWAALMLLLWIDCLTDWMDLELFQAFQPDSASGWIIAAAAIFVALSTIIARPYCRFVCPTGSLFKRVDNIG